MSVVAQAVEGSIVTGSIYGTANLGALAQSTDDGVYALTIWRPADPVSTESGGQDFVTAIRPKLKNGVSASTLNGGDLWPTTTTRTRTGTCTTSWAPPPRSSTP